MKRGFTLIELLAVIVILAIIALIAVPIVINIINDSKKSSQEESIKMYGKAIEQGLANYLLKHPNDTTITLDKIKDYINYNGEAIECGIVQIGKKGEIYLRDCKVGNTKIEYEYGTLINPVPELNNGLTPVIYDGENWKIVSSNDKNWYDYDNQKWANAVVLKQNSTKTIGDIVTVEGEDPDVLMMYVWIPRFEYKIEGRYGTYPDGTAGTQELPGEIEVNFIGKNITKTTTGYRIHPAFTFGDKEELGFWVGKFELSHTTKTTSNINCTTETCSEARYLRILPDKSSLRSNNISNFWYGIKSIENASEYGISNIDTHMMKNSEWGAVAYLSQSKYGKYGNNDYEGAQKEVYINNSSSYYTGRSGGNPGGNTQIKDTYTDQTSTTQYINYGYYTYDGYLLSYNTNNKTETRDINKGTGASTTGNIYGVYDMSGGSNEYVMGVYGTDVDGIYSGYNTTYNSGFNGKMGNDNLEITNRVSLPESKYYNLYKTSNASTACNSEICYGHAMSETRNWYGDYANMLDPGYPWFVRGGHYSQSTDAGVFRRISFNGASDSYISTRVVGISK